MVLRSTVFEEFYRIGFGDFKQRLATQLPYQWKPLLKFTNDMKIPGESAIFGASGTLERPISEAELSQIGCFLWRWFLSVG